MEQHEQDLEEVVNAQTLEELNLIVLPCPFILLEQNGPRFVSFCFEKEFFR
jgi:hypothetical protein